MKKDEIVTWSIDRTWKKVKNYTKMFWIHFDFDFELLIAIWEAVSNKDAISSTKLFFRNTGSKSGCEVRPATVKMIIQGDVADLYWRRRRRYINAIELYQRTKREKTQPDLWKYHVIGNGTTTSYVFA